MMTIVTYVTLKEGTEPQWDEAMRERLMAARDQPGWIGGQLLMPVDALNRRVIVGTWQTRDHWHEWHKDPRFEETRRQLDRLVTGPERHEWHDVVLDVRKDASDGGSDVAAGSRSGQQRTSRTRAR